jgi:hypothetical protein
VEATAGWSERDGAPGEGVLSGSAVAACSLTLGYDDERSTHHRICARAEAKWQSTEVEGWVEQHDNREGVCGQHRREVSEEGSMPTAASLRGERRGSWGQWKGNERETPGLSNEWGGGAIFILREGTSLDCE